MSENTVNLDHEELDRVARSERHLRMQISLERPGVKGEREAGGP